MITRLLRVVPTAWACLLAGLILGPALGPGYVLTYDMVWVPDLAWRGDFLGWGTALPRAVPSDLVISLIDELVPGMLLQKMVLLGALVAGGVGAARLVGGARLTRVVATSVYLWSPLVVERLLIGHWPVLLCWAALPWLVREASRCRDSSHVGAALPLLLVAGSLSANAGVAAGAVVLAVGVSRRRRTSLGLAGLVAAVNAPWAVAGLVHATAATSAGGTHAFALEGEGSLPPPLTALTLGGIWNGDVVPDSRTLLVLVGPATVLVVLAAAYGLRPAAGRHGRRTLAALVGVGTAGYAIAVSTWLLPDGVGWFAAHVPGGGLLRDGARWLLLAAPGLTVLVAEGAARAATRAAEVARTPALRGIVGIGAVLAPVALMPDAAWGGGGALHAVNYPGDYAVARGALAASPPVGDLLVLPFTSYRAPAWNRGRPVLDPLPRYLTPDFVVSDELVVGGHRLPTEDPRTPRVLAALGLGTAHERAVALGQLGIGAVIRERDVPAPEAFDAPVAGRRIDAGPGLELTWLDPQQVVQRRPSPVARSALLLAWVGFVAVAALGVARLPCAPWSENARRSGSG